MILECKGHGEAGFTMHAAQTAWKHVSAGSKRKRACQFDERFAGGLQLLCGPCAQNTTGIQILAPEQEFRWSWLEVYEPLYHHRLDVPAW